MINTATEAAENGPINVIFNWPELLKRNLKAASTALAASIHGRTAYSDYIPVRGATKSVDPKSS